MMDPDDEWQLFLSVHSQVVKNITKLSEESKHSQADNTEKSQSTEVDIKVRIWDIFVC